MSESANVACISPLRVAVEQLSDAALLTGTRNLVGRSNRLLADLLAHLAEVEARGIHRTRACSSLYTYCIYELRFSEDEAFRRVTAARLVRRFPAVLEAVAAGELHLTGLLMLGPHLTEANCVEILARAKHRTKRELARVVRILDPLPAVPARIEPLGPAPAREIAGAATWEAFAGSLCPIRDLQEGDRPREWGVGASDSVPPRVEHHQHGQPVAADGEDDTARTRGELTNLSVPERYAVQFTATEEYVRLVEQAKALLSHTVPNASLDVIHWRAMRTFVAELTKRKYAQTTRPRRSQQSGAFAEPVTPRRLRRHIPSVIRRAVAIRDGMRCTYVDDRGMRCRETHRLEFHHRVPFAVKPAHDLANLTLRCAAHNALDAEKDFGRKFMRTRKGDHERSRDQAVPTIR